jgi:outer membrane protein assembly factor BamB
MVRVIFVAWAAALLVSGCGGLSGWSASEAVGEVETRSHDITAQWSVGVGDGVFAPGDAIEAVVDGDQVLTVDRAGLLQAHRRVDGRRLWRRELGAPVSAGPGIGAGLIVVGTRDGRVLALDRETRALRWEARVSSEVLARPVVHGDTVVVFSHDGRLYGLRASSGAMRWVYDRSLPPLTLRGLTDPLVVDRTLIVGLPNGRLVALDVDAGELLFEARVGIPRGRSDIERMRDVTGRMAVDQGTLFAVSYQGDVVALDARSGSQRWRRALSSSAGLAVRGPQVVVAAVDGSVWALERSGGATLWRNQDLRGLTLTAPVAVDAGLLVADSEGGISLIDPTDGALLARRIIDRSGFSRPPHVDADGGIYALADGGRLHQLRIRGR